MPTDASIIAQNAGIGGNRGLEFNLTTTAGFQLWVSYDGTNWNTISSTGAALVANTWYHVAADHNATGKFRIMSMA